MHEVFLNNKLLPVFFKSMLVIIYFKDLSWDPNYWMCIIQNMIFEYISNFFVCSWHYVALFGNITHNTNTRSALTHWGRVTHICVSKLTIIGSDNGLAPGRRQTIIWTTDGILLIGPLGTNFSEILI